VTEIVQKLT